MRQTITVLILLLWMAAGIGPVARAATVWDVYLLAGQSNMDGRGKVADLSDAQRQPVADARIFYRNPPASTEEWKPLAPGYSIPAHHDTGPLPSSLFGPEIGFARTMQQAHPAGHLALIKGSKGGSSLSKDWNPGLKGQPDTQGPCYRNFLETIALATKALTAGGDTFIARGVLWHQGETDATDPSTSAEIYQQRLTNFIARLREDLGQPDLPFVIGEIFDDGKRDAVRAAQHAVATAVKRTAFASSEGLTTSDAGTHFDAASQLTLGERFTAAVLQIEKERVPADGAHQPATGQHAAVATRTRFASAAGIEILKQGGNAVDAAVAIGFALAVTYPQAGNIGGGGFMLLRTANGKNYFLDYRETAPAAATRDMYLDERGDYVPDSSVVGYRAVAVPGSVAGLALAARTFGRLTLSQDMQPAIKLATNGFLIDAATAVILHEPLLAGFPDSRRIFQRDGNFYRAGEVFRQPELANTLRAIAQRGPDAFYRGPLAAEFAAFMRRNGGLITTEDLAAYQPKMRVPLEGDYRGNHIITAPPPSSGGIALLEMLNQLEGTHYSDSGFLSANAIHDEVEAMRRAFADRAQYLADPDFAPVPVTQLTDKAYARSRFADVVPGVAGSSETVQAGQVSGYESMQTTHYSVVDSAGNAVAVTTTLNGRIGFGSGVTVGKLGFLLNDEMDDFTSKPGVPNIFGLIQGSVNAIQPGKRPLSAMTPTIVTRDGKLFLVLGSPGGPRIITTVFQVLTNIVDFHRDLQSAVDAPRFHQQWLPDGINLEQDGFSTSLQDVLQRMGYRLKLDPRWCDAEAVMVDPASGRRTAASDSRGQGLALAY